MLETLYIKKLAVIDCLEIDCCNGMTALTGATGAGKSILIDALALALGTRADYSLIREDAGSAEVIASFRLMPQSPAQQWLQQQDLVEEQSCTLRRIISRERGSKAYINGRPVALQSLRELGALLVDIHGQHEHHGLLKTTIQRQLLDRFGNLEPKVKRLGQQYLFWHTLQQQIEQLRENSQQRRSQLEFLDFQINELAALDPQPNEATTLDQQQKLLAHTQELQRGLGAALHLVYDDENHSAYQQLARALEQLRQLHPYDPELASRSELLQEALILINDSADDLLHRMENLEADPEQLQVIEDRLGALHALARKHQVAIDALPALLENLRQQHAVLQGSDTDLANLSSKLATAWEDYERLATEISRSRSHIATELSAQVTGYMQQLGMPEGHFKVAVSASLSPSRCGLDQINFQVATNPGQPLKPLSGTASGGELSRIGLAIQVCCTHKLPTSTIVFDEVDVGIGGGVAEIVGRLLHQLATGCQVLCITHLGQVAAQADQHLAVAKNQGSTSTVSVSALSAEQRTEEIARMLGGQTITEKTRDHAREMLSLAAARP